MAATYYERLSFLDSSFLTLERPNSHMHIMAIQIYDAAPLRTAGGGIDIERIRRFIAGRLHLVPRYRQRLAWIPLERHPVWVDDEHFNIGYHIRHTSLPQPGTEEELKALAARLFAQQLDRSKPLWEMVVTEGLDGDRFAFIVKVHHCMIDGVAGVDLLKVIMNLAPADRVEEPVPFEPRPAPSGVTLVADEMARWAQLPLHFAKGFRHFVEATGDARSELEARGRAMWDSARSGWFTKASPTPVNRTIGPHRRFEWMSTPVADLKAIKDGLGGTVNDAVLAVVAGAVRAYLSEHDTDVTGLDYRVMAPVSVRSQTDRSGEGNRVAMWLLDLPIDEEDPVARHMQVMQSTRRLKRERHALGASLLTQMGSYMPLTLLSLGVRLAGAAIRPFNMTVTNVPGPQIPLYLLEAEMLAQYPMVPLWMNHGVGVALFSYNGTVPWGLSADWDQVDDLDRFAELVAGSVEELGEAATGG